MQPDIEKYRKKPQAPSGVDVNKYRKKPAGEFTFPVQEDPKIASANRLAAAQADQAKYDKEASRGFLSRFGSALAKNLVPSQIGLGKTISGILYQGSKADKGLQESIATGEQKKVELLKAIRENEQKGLPTDRLKQAYNAQVRSGQQASQTAKELVQLPTTAQAVGQIGGTVLDVLTAGTYGKARMGMQPGRLAVQGPVSSLASRIMPSTLVTTAPSAVKTAATVVGLPELGTLATQQSRGLFTARGLGNIGAGAATGYASDVFMGLQGLRGEEREGGAAFIPGLGTAIGTSIPLVSEAAQAGKNIMNPEPRTVERRTATLTDLQKKYPKVQAAFEQGQRKGIDVQKTLAETNLLNGAVDEDGLIKSDRAIENFNEFIAPLEGKVREVIQKEGRRVSLDTIARNMDDFVAKTKMESGAYQKLTNELLADLRGLQAKYGNQIPVEALHDTKIFRGSANNYMDTGANAINKEATRFYKDIVEQNVPSLDVAGYNRELSKYYAVRDALEALDGKRVQGGRLGKYFSSVIGSGVGGLAGGPLGAIVGAEAGARVSGVQMASRFGSDLSKGLTVTDEMARAAAERTGKAAIPDVVLPQRTASVGNVVIGANNAVAPSVKSGVLNVVENNQKPPVPRKKQPPIVPWTYVPIPEPKASDFFEPAPLMQSIKNTLKDQTGSIGNPLGKGETALQRTARLRESSAKINRLNTKALDVMEDYVNYFDGGGRDVTLPREQITVGGDVIAKELGFTERGKALADKFREILDARMDKTTRGARMLPVGKVEGATPQTTALLEEAKKYKSAEEFVNEITDRQYVTDRTPQERTALDMLVQKELYKNQTPQPVKISSLDFNERQTLKDYKPKPGATINDPIIVEKGVVKDGHHRVAQAIANGDDTILAFEKIDYDTRRKMLEDIWKQANETSGFAYHGTNPRNLENIKKEGLKTGNYGNLYFAPTEEGTAGYGGATPIKLRVRREFLGDYIEGGVEQGASRLGEIKTKTNIPPENLEIYKDGKWQPLIDA